MASPLAAEFRGAEFEFAQHAQAADSCSGPSSSEAAAGSRRR
ncbi:MAG TPA: hypothetical protein VH372_19795 [Actinospica sp.]|nr:hypothetical protein [Actinospica sp.]